VVTGGVLWLLVRVLTQSPRKRNLVRCVLLLTGFLVLQLCLGIASYIAKLAAIDAPQPLSPSIEITAAHVVVGALLLASSMVLTLQTFGNIAAPCRTIVETRLEENREPLVQTALSFERRSPAL